MLDSIQAPKDEIGQLNFKDVIQLEETKENKASKFELKPSLEELEYIYLGDQQTYLAVISSQLTKRIRL